MLESYKGKNNLLGIDWYLSKMSMFLKESYGIVEELKWDVDLLNDINGVSDAIMTSFDIYSITFPKDKDGNIITPYEELMQQIDSENESKQESEKIYYKALDIIASLVGISRTVKIANECVKLSNYELWQYIIITIAKNNFKGTNEEIIKSYEKAHIEIYYITGEAMTCSVKVNKQPSKKGMNKISEKMCNLFTRDDFPLLIQSVGVNYNVDIYRDSPTSFILDNENNLDNYSSRLE